MKGSPSRADGLPWEAEERFRLLGCQLIQQAAMLLKMPQAAVLTGQVLFHQLFYKRSFLELPVLDGAMAALFVAGKVEECYRRARDIVNVFYWLHGRHRNGRGPARLPYICDEYYNWRDRLTTTEMFLLRDLGFRVQPEAKLAVLMLISYLQAFEGLARADPDLGQCALNLLNDAFKTVAPLIFKPEELACGAIYLAARTRGLLDVLPDDNMACWHRVFGVVTRARLEAACDAMLDVREIRLDTGLPMVPTELEVFARVFATKGHERQRMPRDQRSRSPHQRPCSPANRS